jgi:hypothetical protein
MKCATTHTLVFLFSFSFLLLFRFNSGSEDDNKKNVVSIDSHRLAGLFSNRSKHRKEKVKKTEVCVRMFQCIHFLAIKPEEGNIDYRNVTKNIIIREPEIYLFRN